ncbi:SHOCT domain-containing protein [Curtobacterium sp. MCBD17_028]|uniref:SHOCT domain-containing protein n=1 Tax=Curtobacterium sp. MCBD17_028 TaxID=2175670 RepID=UPI000DAA41A6|nr:SHOCT domain-containing protein [Curtobacterium sp. MCBD17_028]PZE23898.1 SHOCT domain-containing protein [Curtobacterium sp. MCBD17_028]
MTPALTALAAAPSWHGGPPMAPFAVVFLATLVVLALVFGVLRRGPWRARSDARAVLADRFARGEIDATEYRARSSELDRR